MILMIGNIFMIKLKDLITEAQLSKLQIFSPGTGGKHHTNWKFDPNKVICSIDNHQVDCETWEETK